MFLDRRTKSRGLAKYLSAALLSHNGALPTCWHLSHLYTGKYLPGGDPRLVIQLNGKKYSALETQIPMPKSKDAYVEVADEKVLMLMLIQSQRSLTDHRRVCVKRMLLNPFLALVRLAELLHSFVLLCFLLGSPIFASVLLRVCLTTDDCLPLCGAKPI